MDNQKQNVAQVTYKPWLVMENGRRLYAHVIGLPYFALPREVSESNEKTN